MMPRPLHDHGPSPPTYFLFFPYAYGVDASWIAPIMNGSHHDLAGQCPCHMGPHGAMDHTRIPGTSLSSRPSNRWGEQ